MKKQTRIKKSQNTQSTETTVVVHTRRQRFFGILALAGLFFCGFMLGTDVQTKHQKVNIDSNVVNIDESASACEVIEQMLLERVRPDGVFDWGYPENNVKVYEQLVRYGCPENKEKYQQMVLRETQIVEAMTGDTISPENTRNCETIERLLNRELSDTDSLSFHSHMANAKIYANLSERGCAENHQKYVGLARQELEIARALQDDELSENDTIEVVETYKRIQMQHAAKEILDKAKKLTNPAIDFIIELEKIINE